MDKPVGPTSHDVVHRVRRALKTRAAGHTGTLDPFASGLLVVLVGRATRLARFVEGQPKRYLATARLGTQTATDDLTGDIIARFPHPESVPEVRLREELATFLGQHPQRPPAFSAKRVAGERSYRRARRGELMELAEVPVTVHDIELVEYRPPDLCFRAVVGPGTYVRALARDLGNQLGVGAHLTALRREAIGSLVVEDAVPLEQLGPAALLSPQSVLRDLPSVDLDDTERKAVVHGRPVKDTGAAGQRAGGAVVALLGGGELIAVAQAEDGWLRPTVVLDTP
ncbi:MAG TPA: tRNA pseudouridine(55) synthase TruB [Gemmatimonadales bacterium]|nr:tRNA pseudouridine(55) synthase TruB [Gemmatimonadales bacterium]